MSHLQNTQLVKGHVQNGFITNQTPIPHTNNQHLINEVLVMGPARPIEYIVAVTTWATMAAAQLEGLSHS